MVRKENGYILAIVVILVVIFITIGIGILSLSEREITTTRIDSEKTRAFYLAEAGLAKMSETLQNPATGEASESLEGSMEQGAFQVRLDTNEAGSFVTSTGTSGNVQKTIRVKANFLATPFEDAVFAMNKGGGSWGYQLRGTGNPVASGSGEKGGKDMVNGNIFVDGDVFLYDQSSVNPAPAPNTYSLYGDVKATGNISVLGSAHISGATQTHAEAPTAVDLIAMDYANNNTHNVSKIFADAGVSKGSLPASNALRDIFQINPNDRSAECATTTGKDYFMEPVNVTGGGTQKDAPTPVHLGNKRVYYVDGDVWVHSKASYGFTVDGQATIVATGDIHICDNIKYKDVNSLLGLVALGKYNSSGVLTSGGNIFFGDPVYGTMYIISAMMFAGNDFLYNTDPISRMTGEPTTGFTVYGNFAAMNKKVLERDWYTASSTSHTTRSGSGGLFGSHGAPARYNAATGKWVDSETGKVLSSSDTSSLRHYQMIVNYDARVRNQATRPPGLPIGGSKIFAGFSMWQEI
jgi:hypothetical protein